MVLKLVCAVALFGAVSTATVQAKDFYAEETLEAIGLVTSTVLGPDYAALPESCKRTEPDPSETDGPPEAFECIVNEVPVSVWGHPRYLRNGEFAFVSYVFEMSSSAEQAAVFLSDLRTHSTDWGLTPQAEPDYSEDWAITHRYARCELADWRVEAIAIYLKETGGLSVVVGGGGLDFIQPCDEDTE
ncbi:MAG: hypothetical protein QNJ16_03525 [Rhodobacter sp.]|nr:hypothetical protein [Rhodobacter sp.]